jgi:hypothetical protein
MLTTRTLEGMEPEEEVPLSSTAQVLLHAIALAEAMQLA